MKNAKIKEKLFEHFNSCKFMLFIPLSKKVTDTKIAGATD